MANEGESEMCKKCGDFPPSTRKNVQKGLCCNRCPNHGPWCTSQCTDHQPSLNLAEESTQQPDPVPASAKGSKRTGESKMCKKCGDFPPSTRKNVQKGLCCNRCPNHGPLCTSHCTDHQPSRDLAEESTEQPDPVRASAKGRKRTATGDGSESALPTEARVPHKRCKLTRELRFIVQEVRSSQGIPKSLRGKLSASLSVLCPLTHPLDPSQQKAFRTFNETLNLIEATQAEEVQEAEALASQARKELEAFEKVADAEMEVAESSGNVDIKSGELSESVAALSVQKAVSEIAAQQEELSATDVNLDAATKTQQECAEALDQAELTHRKIAEALEERVRLLPALRSVTAEVVEKASAACKRLEDFQRGPQASFLDIAAELVSRHGISILDDGAAAEAGSPQNPEMQVDDSNALLESTDLSADELACKKDGDVSAVVRPANKLGRISNGGA